MIALRNLMRASAVETKYKPIGTPVQTRDNLFPPLILYALVYFGWRGGCSAAAGSTGDVTLLRRFRARR